MMRCSLVLFVSLFVVSYAAPVPQPSTSKLFDLGFAVKQPVGNDGPTGSLTGAHPNSKREATSDGAETPLPSPVSRKPRSNSRLSDSKPRSDNIAIDLKAAESKRDNALLTDTMNKPMTDKLHPDPYVDQQLGRDLAQDYSRKFKIPAIIAGVALGDPVAMTSEGKRDEDPTRSLDNPYLGVPLTSGDPETSGLPFSSVALQGRDSKRNLSDLPLAIGGEGDKLGIIISGALNNKRDVNQYTPNSPPIGLPDEDNEGSMSMGEPRKRETPVVEVVERSSDVAAGGKLHPIDGTVPASAKAMHKRDKDLPSSA